MKGLGLGSLDLVRSIGPLAYNFLIVDVVFRLNLAGKVLSVFFERFGYYSMR